MYSTIKIIKRISLVVLALSCITFSPTAQATCHEGCGGFNFNTFLGEDALLNNTGVDNTAIGANALLNNTGVDNTAVGALALRSNTTGGNTQDSSSNYPIVQLRSLDSSQVVFLPVDPAFGWSDTSFTSLPVKAFPFGPALVTVFTNGIPSEAKSVIVTKRHR